MCIRDRGDLAGALEGFEALGSFLDSDARARSLRAEIPSRELERIASLVEPSASKPSSAPARSPSSARRAASMSVSYTHLDVYKRQVSPPPVTATSPFSGGR